MRRVLIAILAVASVILVPQIMFAADLPVKAPPPVAPVSSWSGFYLGAGIGLRSNVADGSMVSGTNNGVPLANFGGFGCATPGPGCAAESLNSTGARVSGYLGYNWQFAPAWVAGVEGDIAWGDSKTTQGGMIYPGGGVAFYITGRTDDSFEFRTRWDASLRARLGYLVTPSFLLYATGGAAWQNVEATSTCGPTNSCTPGGFGPGVISDSTTKTGWTVGGGIETAFGGHWIGRVEYRYADFGTISNTDSRVFPAGGVTQTARDNIDLTTHTITFGLSYKFGDPLPSASAAIAWAASGPINVASWSGFYVGAGAGLRSWIADGSMVSGTNNGVRLANFGGFGCATPGPGCANESLDGTGARVSGYLGYNWQFAPAWVGGIEGDFGWSNQTARSSGILYPGGGVVFYLTGRADDAFEVKPTWDGSLRGRVGYLVTPSFLVYATGGVAWQKVETTSVCGASFSCNPGGFGPSVITDSKTKTGWTIGGGLETMLSSHWFARAEYRYADFGTVTNTDTRICCGGIPIVTQVATYNVELQTHTATFGLAYKF
jgi:outer membrane immunogenic protein